MRFIDMVQPIVALLPEIEMPTRKVPFREKAMWTVATLLVFLILCQVPLYGIRVSSSADPLHWLRVLTASNRETLMELGISPIVTSGMVLQLISGSKLISMDQSSKSDRAAFQGLQKLVGLLITLGQAVAYVSSGMYGDVRDLGSGNCALIVLQLTMTGVIVIMLDEMLSKGYGLGSGVSLFIAANICESIVWRSLSPARVDTPRGSQYEGALPAFFHLLLTRDDKLGALRDAFYRAELPNMLNLLATLCVFLVVIFFEGFRVELMLKPERVRGRESAYPIKLFYTSNVPIILQSALVSNFFFASKFLAQSFPGSRLVRLLGVWAMQEGSRYSVPVWGLALYMTPPKSLFVLFRDPLHLVFYLTFVLGSSALFSRLWIEVSGSSPSEVAKQLAKEGMVIKGYRSSSTVNVLKRIIPIAATFGGMCIGALTIFADYMGAIGSGTGILLVVSIIFQYFEIYAKEIQKDGGNLFSLLNNAE